MAKTAYGRVQRRNIGQLSRDTVKENEEINNRIQQLEDSKNKKSR